MALRYDANYDNPTLDFDLPEAVTASNVNSLTQPVANAKNASSSFNFNDAIHNVLSLLDDGLSIYSKVNDITDQAASKNADQQQRVSPVTVSAAQPSFVLGLSTNQLLWIAGGLALVLILPRLSKG